jgi:hypothetical protein
MKKRYLVKQETHLGPIQRKILVGQVIEWDQDSGLMLLDDVEVKGQGVDTFRGMQTLLTLSERNPKEPYIVPLDSLPNEKTIGSNLKTDTLCTLPILGCLQAAEIFIGSANPEWKTVSARQVEFLEKFKRYWINPVKLPELRSKADVDLAVINKWLKDEGFDIQLDPVDVGFYVASILKLLVEWLKVGKKRNITGKRDGKTYPGVKLKDGVRLYRDLEIHPFSVAHLDTKNGDVVKMAIIDAVPEGAFGLHDLTQTLNKVTSPDQNKEDVVFPMVELDVKPNISWICGMKLEEYWIQQALQQTKFRMNEKGAKVESAVAMSFRKGMAFDAKQPYVIDRPFLLWIERPGMTIPFFAAVLCEDVWREPKEL